MVDDPKFKRFYVDWWSIRKSTVYVLVAVVVLGGTSLLGGRGFPISTAVAAFFLNQLSQFALAVGVPYSAQTIIQAFALGLGIAVYSLRRPRRRTKHAEQTNKLGKLPSTEKKNEAITS